MGSREKAPKDQHLGHHASLDVRDDLGDGPRFGGPPVLLHRRDSLLHSTAYARGQEGIPIHALEDDLACVINELYSQGEVADSGRKLIHIPTMEHYASRGFSHNRNAFACVDASILVEFRVRDLMEVEPEGEILEGHVLVTKGGELMGDTHQLRCSVWIVDLHRRTDATPLSSGQRIKQRRMILEDQTKGVLVGVPLQNLLNRPVPTRNRGLR